MDLGLTEIQLMLKNSAREFLSQECPLTFVREMENNSQGYTEEFWQQLASLGWTGLAFPEVYGGTGGTFTDLAVLLEEMGRTLSPSPFFSTVVLSGLTILEAGSASQKQDFLPQICAGSTKIAFALTEATATYEPWGVETISELANGNYQLSGTKLFVQDAHTADWLLVAAKTDLTAPPERGITVFLIPSKQENITINLLNTIALDNQCEIVFDNLQVSSDCIVGSINEGWPIIESALQRAIAGQCIEMLGGADAVLDMTVEYAKQRTQFGRPVGSFQAVQHHCANMATDVEGCRQIAYQAAWRVSEGLPSFREVAMAKAWVSGAYQRVCATAHQCHGAIGFTKEHDLQLYTRRAKTQELRYGDVSSHKETVLQQIETE